MHKAYFMPYKCDFGDKRVIFKQGLAISPDESGGKYLFTEYSETLPSPRRGCFQTPCPRVYESAAVHT